MTCGSLAEILLDMARGAAVPEASRRSAEQHMDGCRSCAAEYATQRELTAGLQALAADAQEWQAPASMETRLLAAFAERQPVVASAKVATSRWKYALPAAAAIALAVWGGVRAVREPAPDFRPFDRLRASPTTVDGPLKAEATQRPVSEDFRLKPEATRVDAGRRASGRTANPRTANPRIAASVAAVEFVRIPSAIGLPDMESGTVVRMELPVTAFPEYGLDIAPDAARTSVEADVLVGQDGQPRAIRLVGIPEAVAQDSRSRQ